MSFSKKDNWRFRIRLGDFVKEWKEFDRRDNWQKMASEVERLAEGRQVWVIKCPATEGILEIPLGNYYALALQKYLERKGRYVILDTRQDWGCDEGADVVLVSRGKIFFTVQTEETKNTCILCGISGHRIKVSQSRI